MLGMMMNSELIAPSATGPVQLLFCILYAWNDDEIQNYLHPLPRTRFSFYFASYMLGMMMKFKIICTPSHGPGSAFILHPICLEWFWINCTPPTDPVQLLFCTLCAWNDDGLIPPHPTDPVQDLICTLYAWNDDELIALPPTDPVQLLFCIPCAWNDDALFAPPPTDPVQHLFCTLYAWNDDELIAPPPTDPVQLLFCIPCAWNDDALFAPPPTDPVQLLFCILYAWNDDELLTQLYIKSKQFCCWFWIFFRDRKGGAIAPIAPPGSAPDKANVLQVGSDIFYAILQWQIPLNLIHVYLISNIIYGNVLKINRTNSYRKSLDNFKSSIGSDRSRDKLRL